MDSDGENDELLERLPWGVWRCCDEAAPIYGREYDTLSELKQAMATGRKAEAKGWAELVGTIAYGELGPGPRSTKADDVAEMMHGDEAEVHGDEEAEVLFGACLNALGYRHQQGDDGDALAGDADSSAWEVMQKAVLAEAGEEAGQAAQEDATSRLEIAPGELKGEYTLSSRQAQGARTATTSPRRVALPGSSCPGEEADECVVLGARSREERDAELRRSAIDVDACCPASASSGKGLWSSGEPGGAPASGLSVERSHVERSHLSRSIRFYDACARLDSALGAEEVLTLTLTL